MSGPPFANLAAYATRLGEIVPDNKPGYNREDLVREALRLFSGDVPFVAVADVGDGTKTAWDLTASPFATAWKEGFSDLFPVEVEVLDGSGASQEPREFLIEGEDFRTEWRSTDGTSHRWLVFATAPASTNARVRISRPYVVNNATPTATNEVPEHLQEAAVKRAAAYVCDLLATYYLRSVDPASGSDVSIAYALVAEYRTAAERWLSEYKSAVGMGDATHAITGRCDPRVPRVFPLTSTGEW